MDKELGKIIDARGLKCPLPVLRLRREAEGYSGTVTLVTDDPAALADVPAFCGERVWPVILSSSDRGVATWAVRVP